MVAKPSPRRNHSNRKVLASKKSTMGGHTMSGIAIGASRGEFNVTFPLRVGKPWFVFVSGWKMDGCETSADAPPVPLNFKGNKPGGEVAAHWGLSAFGRTNRRESTIPSPDVGKAHEKGPPSIRRSLLIP